jgi:GxxExxY protein
MLDYESGLGKRVIGLGIDVHRALGPDLLESVYEECLCHELRLAGIEFARQVPLPVTYKGVKLDCGYRLDVLVGTEIVLEVKAVDRLLPIHDAQVLTYLRLSGHKAGLLMNFNAITLKEGLRRLVSS